MPQTILLSRAKFDVGVLFYNRASQTLDCVLSFLDEDIQPNIVILDQGSVAEQRKRLNEALGRQPNVRFIDVVENIGVAAGRNWLCRECSAGWILFTDNDVTLNTRGGVAHLNSAVQRADDVEGILPRLLNVHENRFVDRVRLTDASGHLRRERVGPDDATTNMFPGGAVVLRRSFLLDNPFYENCFVGFEDWELAARAFTLGRPLRMRILDDVTLVHKHMPVVSEPDIASTQIRYSPTLIVKSVDVLKAKYGGELLTGYWESWIEKQQQEMIVSHRIAPRIPADKINITFVVDLPNRALDNIVRNLDLHMGDGHALTIVYANKADIGQSLQLTIDSCPDVIHFMWREHFRKLVCKAGIQKCAALMSLTEAEVLDRLCQSHVTFSVCDHLFLDEKDIDFFRPLYWLSDGYNVESPLLFDIYGLISDYPKPVAMIPNGVDRTFYHPASPAKRENPTIRIGWVGNSSWGDSFGLPDVKGLKTIICPSVELLREEGIDVELLVCDRVERWRTRDEMAAFYRELDLYVCASSVEGTPNPVLEAMASGIPVVATKVGIVSYVFGPQQQSFIVERSIEAVSSAMRQLCLEPELRRRLAQENLQQIAKHDWATRAPLWRAFFVDVIRHTHPDASNWKRFMIEKYFLIVDK